MELAFIRNAPVMREGRVIEYPIDMYRMGKDEKSKAIQNILGGYLKQKNPGSYKISIGLSGQSVFLRFMDIPKVDTKKMAKIVQYEAMQQVPFPLEDVIWDYNFLKTKDPKVLSIVLAAVKKDIVDSVLNILSGLGTIPDFVDLTPLSLYNAVRFSKFTDKAVIIDMGTESTDVLIVDKDRLWTRTILIGGNDITKTMAFELNIGFEEAEKLKIERGVIIGRPRDGLHSSEEIRISNAITPPLVDLLKEISQSLGYYKSQYKDVGVFDKIFVTGGAARLTGIEEFLGMHFLMNIEKLEMFKNNTKITIPKEFGGKTDRLGVAFGLALRGVTDATATKINLLPKERLLCKKFERQKPVLYRCLYGIIILSLVSSLFILGKLTFYTRQIYRINQMAAGYEKCLSTTGSELADVRIAEKKLSVMADITAERRYWLRALSTINRYMPEDAVIEDLRASDAEMTVKGSGKNDLIAEEFKNRLERSKHYESVEVLSETDNSAQPDKIGKTFSMRIVLNKDHE
jgi:type IV pilus assembly protein PilM